MCDALWVQKGMKLHLKAMDHTDAATEVAGTLWCMLAVPFPRYPGFYCSTPICASSGEVGLMRANACLMASCMPVEPLDS